MNSLQTVSNKYKSAQNEIKEHILAMDNLVKTCKYNEERFDSLVKYQCECQRSMPDSSKSVCADNIIPPQKLYDSAIAEDIKIINNSNITKNNIIVYSDDMGKNLGITLNNSLKGQKVTNCCMPGASFSDILNKIIVTKFCPNSTIIIFVGRRGSVNNKQLLRYIEQLNNLNVHKIVLFTLPYIQGLPQENNLRHNLNIQMHNLICNNNLNLTYNSNDNNHKFHVIDINNLIKKFWTKDRYYLSKYNLRLIANVLSYYLLFNSAKFLATKTAFIEHNHLTFNLESVPTNLN
ncbi:unnamed protein product [Parnassius mnemosyne]|uniref:Uncharacterized protein n=1 Tax=Parnassius mnemosyne TaxID=213953 RepID=A0AAV1LBL7_9NEOP